MTQPDVTTPEIKNFKLFSGYLRENRGEPCQDLDKCDLLGTLRTICFWHNNYFPDLVGNKPSKQITAYQKEGLVKMSDLSKNSLGNYVCS